MKICVFVSQKSPAVNVEPYQSSMMKSMELNGIPFLTVCPIPCLAEISFSFYSVGDRAKREGNLCIAGYMHHNITVKDSAEKTPQARIQGR